MKHRNASLIFIYIACIVFAFFCIANVFLVSINHYHFRSNTNFDSYINSSTTSTETIYAKRGNIYDVNGELIAYDIYKYDIICYLDKNRIGPNNSIEYVDDPVYTSRILANILDIPQDEILYYLTYDPSLYQTELGPKGRNLSEEIKDEILNTEGIHGIGFRKTTSRYYTQGSEFSPYLIGYTLRNDKGEIEGVYGLEKYLNDDLAGENGYHSYQADKNGYILPGMFEDIVESKDGYDVYTTIDTSIQQALNTAVNNIKDTNDASDAWGAVMEIESGKILAWDQTPSFNPNDLDFKTYLNYGSQYTYEPASTIKSILWSAAMDLDVYDGNAIFDSSKYYYTEKENGEPKRVSPYDNYLGSIQNAGGYSWGLMTYDKGLAYSSNVGSCSLLENYVGTKNYYDYLLKFGFFKDVDSDGIEESTTFLNYNYLSEKLSLTYGQGSSFTMLQLIQAYSAIFGNGEMVKPYYIDKIVDSNTNEIIYTGKRTVTGTPIKESTARKMQDLLYRCVYNYGASTGYYRVNETSIIGKSGTAEIYENGVGYRNDKSITSAMIAFPADNPKYIIYFAYISPYRYNNHANSATIKGLVKKVAILTNEAVPLEGDDDYFKKMIMDDYSNKNVGVIKDNLLKNNVEVVIIGNGDKIVDQYPKVGNEYYTNSKVYLLTDNISKIKIPDFKGWTRKEIVTYWNLSNIPIVINGYGIVTNQSIDPNTLIDNNEEIIVYLEDIK